MPTDSYRDSFIEQLTDPEHSSTYIETALEETIKDGDVDFFRLALEDVLEAAERRKTPVAEIYLLRQAVYRRLLGQEHLTVESAEAALQSVDIVPERQPAEV